MKQHPILFATPMVQAILAGTKPQTRRLVKAGFDISDGVEFNSLKYNEIAGLQAFFKHHTQKGLYGVKFPKGNIGDVLWVKETHQDAQCFDYNTKGYVYKADKGTDEFAKEHKINWRPSIHMPKAAARLYLRITNIRVERLLDISEQDAIAEGIERVGDLWFKNYLFEKDDVPKSFIDPYISFQSLWSKINGKESWEENPFVWVIEFEKIDF